MVFHQFPSYGVVVDPSPYRPATRVMMSLPPLRFQNSFAASSSEERNMTSSVLRSSDESFVCPLASCRSRSSAMNSLATDAIGYGAPLPFEITWLVLRSSTVVEIFAPALEAWAVACWARALRPAKAAAGWSGGASGNGALVPIGATTVSCGAAASGGVPYTLASQPAMSG